jgi:hypothetical protein
VEDDRVLVGDAGLAGRVRGVSGALAAWRAGGGAAAPHAEAAAAAADPVARVGAP